MYEFTDKTPVLSLFSVCAAFQNKIKTFSL